MSNPWKRREVIGSCTLYLGDCMEIMPTLGTVDAVVTDPPYGMSWNGKVTRGKNGTGKAGATRHHGTRIINDDKPFDPSPFMHERCILWGMNHFPQHLSKGSVLVWLKRYESGFGSFLSDAEVAWFNKGHGVYCFRDMSNQADSRERKHPTQKPVPLMEWCLTFVPDAKTILDPFAGSGTTGVACVKTGRSFIGIEQHEPYFDIACERIRKAYAQPDMFVSAPKQNAVQEAMDL